jgi:hypothetical protein
VETGKTYKSSIEAEKATGINSSCIRRVCSGERKEAGGLHWKHGVPTLREKIFSFSDEELAKLFVFQTIETIGKNKYYSSIVKGEFDTYKKALHASMIKLSEKVC